MDEQLTQESFFSSPPDAILIADESPTGRSVWKVFQTLFGSSMNLWPPKGISVDSLQKYNNPAEFWLITSALPSTPMHFASNVSFSVPPKAKISAWSWFIAHTYPDTTLRFIHPPHALFKALIKPPKPATSKHFNFSLSFLGPLFKEMKNLADLTTCGRVSNWLLTIPEPLFSVLKDYQNSSIDKIWSSLPPDSYLIQNKADWFSSAASGFKKWATRSNLSSEMSSLAQAISFHLDSVAKQIPSSSPLKLCHEICALFELLATHKHLNPVTSYLRK